jgi:virulence factor Mce-like protein
MQRTSVAGNPVLIGAATVLVVLVAVFLAYNANQGLPFVPTYSLTAQAPSAANLVRGNDVRIGGTRVGSVDKIEVKRLEDGTSIAELGLKLERSVAPLPRDSTVIVRPRSALGLKYVELTRGTSSEGFEDGDTMPLASATPAPVEFDEFTNMFDEDTRDAAATNLEGFGDAFAGRGQSINQAIGALRPLLRDIIPVAQNLSSRETNLPRFIGELADAASIVAPAAESQAQLFVNLDATFGALREVARPYIQESISEGPETLDAAIAGFPVQRPFLANTEALFRELRPGVRALRTAAPDLADALELGTPVLKRSPPFNDRLASLLTELQTFAEDPLVPRGIRRLTDTVRTLDPTLQFLAPTQTTCNYIAHWFRNIASLLSEGDANGTWQRFIIVANPQGPNNEGGPSSGPADGPTLENHLHSNPYPNTAAPDQPRECEAGNETFIKGRTVTSNVPGTQQAVTEGNP